MPLYNPSADPCELATSSFNLRLPLLPPPPPPALSLHGALLTIYFTVMWEGGGHCEESWS